MLHFLILFFLQIMLYVDMEVNGFPLKVRCCSFYVLRSIRSLSETSSNRSGLRQIVQAFVDSGAQSTIISKNCAERCGYVSLQSECHSLFATFLRIVFVLTFLQKKANGTVIAKFTIGV